MRATLRAIRLLMLRRIRLQPLRAAVAAVTIGAGVALAISILIVVNSAGTSAERVGSELAGITELRLIGATSRGGLDPATIEAAARVPGVRAVVPMVQTVTTAITADGLEQRVLILGADCRIDALLGQTGCTDATLAAMTGPPLVSPSFQRDLGPGAVIKTDAGRVVLDGAPAIPQLDDIADGRVMVFPLTRAQELFARGARYDVAYLDTDPTVDKQAVEQAVGDHIGVLGADDPPPGIGSVLESVIPLFGLAALIALGVGGVLVHNTVALSMEERRRQLAVVGALGGTARVLVFGSLAEAALLGLVGGVVGAGAGALLARPITAVFSDFTEQVAGIPLRVYVTASDMVVALLLGAVVAVVAAWRPARRSRQLNVAAELSARSVAAEARARSLTRRFVIWSVVMVVGLAGCFVAGRGGALEPWQAAVAPITYVVAVIGMALAMGTLAPLLIGAVGQRLPTRRATLRLALTNLGRDAGRVGVMAVAIGVACAIAFVTASFKESVRTAVTDSFTRNVPGVVISAVKADEVGQLGGLLPPSTADTVKALPGVADVNRSATLLIGHTANDLVLVEGYDRIYTDGFPTATGTVDHERFAAGEVVIGTALAREEGVRPGDHARLDTPTGSVELPVQAVVYDGSLSGRNLAMSFDRMTEIYGPQPLTGMTVDPAPGVSAAQLFETVKGADIDPDIQVLTAYEAADAITEAVGDQLQVFWALQRGMLLLSFIAVVSTLLLVGLQRQREIGLLGAVGMRPRDLRTMVVTEALILGVVAVVLGLITSVPMYAGLLLIGPVIFGFSQPLVVDPAAAIVWGLVGVAVAGLASLWPAWRTSRTDILEALRYE